MIIIIFWYTYIYIYVYNDIKCICLFKGWISQREGIYRYCIWTIQLEDERIAHPEPRAPASFWIYKELKKKHIKPAALIDCTFTGEGDTLSKVVHGTHRAKRAQKTHLQIQKNISSSRLSQQVLYQWQQTKGHIEVGQAELHLVRGLGLWIG